MAVPMECILRSRQSQASARYITTWSFGPYVLPVCYFAAKRCSILLDLFYLSSSLVFYAVLFDYSVVACRNSLNSKLSAGYSFSSYRCAGQTRAKSPLQPYGFGLGSLAPRNHALLFNSLLLGYVHQSSHLNLRTNLLNSDSLNVEATAKAGNGSPQATPSPKPAAVSKWSNQARSKESLFQDRRQTWISSAEGSRLLGSQTTAVSASTYKHIAGDL